MNFQSIRLRNYDQNSTESALLMLQFIFHQVCSKLQDGHVAYTNTMTRFYKHKRWQYSCDKCYGLKLVLDKGLLDQHQHKTYSNSAI